MVRKEVNAKLKKKEKKWILFINKYDNEYEGERERFNNETMQYIYITERSGVRGYRDQIL